MHLICKLTEVDCLVWWHYLKVLLLDDSFDVEAGIDGIVAFDEFFVLVFGWDSEFVILADCKEFTHLWYVNLSQFSTEFSFIKVLFGLWAEFGAVSLTFQFIE